jgi:methionyl-tRNA formyltransferase
MFNNIYIWYFYQSGMVIKTVYFGNNKDILTTLDNNSELMHAVIKNSNGKDYWIEPLKRELYLRKILYHTPETLKNNDEIYDVLKSSNPDLLVCCGYHLRIPQKILDIPKIASINIHPAFLPKYRGQHVIQWALANGEQYTGVTLHHMTDKFDEGDIISQKKIEILPEDNALTLHSKIHKTGSILLETILSDLESGKTITRIPQNHSEATYYHARKPEDGKIDWNKTPEEINNLVRALVYPWPGAYTEYYGEKMIIDGFKFFKPSEYSKLNLKDTKLTDKIILSGKHGIYMISPENIRNPIL